MHLCGNLQHFIGHVLGGSAYDRDRVREFAAKDVPRAQLLDDVNSTIEAVDDALAQLDPIHLAQPYPIRVLPEEATTAYFLLHLNYHLGQMNYLRRVL